MRPSYEEWLMAALIKYGVGNEQVWHEKVDYRSATFKTAHICPHKGITQDAVDWLKTQQEKKG